jgi:hypothetical protein
MLEHTAWSLLALQLTGSKQLFPQAFYFILLTVWHDFVLQHSHPDVGDNSYTVTGRNLIPSSNPSAFGFTDRCSGIALFYFAYCGLSTTSCLMTVTVIVFLWYRLVLGYTLPSIQRVTDFFMVHAGSGVHPAFLSKGTVFLHGTCWFWGTPCLPFKGYRLFSWHRLVLGYTLPSFQRVLAFFMAQAGSGVHPAFLSKGTGFLPGTGWFWGTPCLPFKGHRLSSWYRLLLGYTLPSFERVPAFFPPG